MSPSWPSRGQPSRIRVVAKSANGIDVNLLPASRTHVHTSELLRTPDDVNGEVMSDEGGDDAIDRTAKAPFVLVGREEIHVGAEPVDDAMLTDCAAASESKPA